MKGTYVVGRDWIFITRAILRQIASAVSMQPRYSHLGPDSSPIPMIIVTRITMSPTPLSARRRVPIDSCRVIEGRSTTIKRTSVRENPADGIGTRGWIPVFVSPRRLFIALGKAINSKIPIFKQRFYLLGA